MTKPRLDSPILIIAPDSDHLIRAALRQAGISRPVLSLFDPGSLDHYLDGTGCYADRKKFPLPGLILQEVTLPKLTLAEALPWLTPRTNGRQIVVTNLIAPLEPWHFESATALSPSTILCQLPSDDSFPQFIEALITSLALPSDLPALV
jgi:hypothetical protein